MQIVLATHNEGKKREFIQLCSELPFLVQNLSDYPHIPESPEDHDTFDGNALQKATFVHAYIPNAIIIADDSGLCVDALNGAPGVYSKRYSTEQTSHHNNQKLLRVLESIENRTAHFHCSIAIVSSNKEWIVQGKCFGNIAHAPKGEGGFGYDPLFIPNAFPDRTMAQLHMNEKNSISHRGQAMKKLQSILDEIVAQSSPYPPKTQE